MGLKTVVESLSKYLKKDWNIYVCFQAYTNDDLKEAVDFISQVCCNDFQFVFTEGLTGCHLARMQILDLYNSDVWCLLDDDMIAIDKTKYDLMANIVWNIKDIGLLSGNWRRNETMAEKAVAKDNIIVQNIVYTGGGLFFRNEVAEIIKAIPRKLYVFDNPLWSIYTYVNGYSNARYLGSIAVHKVCTVGGRRRYFDEVREKKYLPPEEWISSRKAKNAFDEYLMCDSSDITPLAHKLHLENLKK